MLRYLTMLCALLGISVVAPSDEASKAPALRLLFSEVQAGSMSSEQYCALLFDDHTYHFEKANLKMGKDIDRRIYEGELTRGDWDTLIAILDSKQLRELNVAPQVPPLELEDAHAIAISVARGNKFQNMEFVDNRSRKPYDAQLKPLLHWWRSFRGERMEASKASASERCSLDSTHGIFAH